MKVLFNVLLVVLMGCFNSHGQSLSESITWLENKLLVCGQTKSEFDMASKGVSIRINETTRVLVPWKNIKAVSIDRITDSHRGVLSHAVYFTGSFKQIELRNEKVLTLSASAQQRTKQPWTSERREACNKAYDDAWEEWHDGNAAHERKKDAAKRAHEKKYKCCPPGFVGAWRKPDFNYPRFSKSKPDKSKIRECKEEWTEPTNKYEMQSKEVVTEVPATRLWLDCADEGSTYRAIEKAIKHIAEISGATIVSDDLFQD